MPGAEEHLGRHVRLTLEGFLDTPSLLGLTLPVFFGDRKDVHRPLFLTLVPGHDPLPRILCLNFHHSTVVFSQASVLLCNPFLEVHLFKLGHIWLELGRILFKPLSPPRLRVLHVDHIPDRVSISSRRLVSLDNAQARHGRGH